MISESVHGVTGQTEREGQRQRGEREEIQGDRETDKERPREKQKKTHQFSVPM